MTLEELQKLVESNAKAIEAMLNQAREDRAQAALDKKQHQEVINELRGQTRALYRLCSELVGDRAAIYESISILSEDRVKLSENIAWLAENIAKLANVQE